MLQPAGLDLLAESSSPVECGSSRFDASASTGQQALLATLRGDLALCLWVIWCTTHMSHTFVVQPLGQIAGYVTGAIVG